MLTTDYRPEQPRWRPNPTIDRRLPQADPNLFLQEVGEELLVYVPSSRTAHRLDSLATLVFRHCDGETSISVVFAEFHSKQLSKNPEETVLEILHELSKKGIVRFAENSAVLTWVTSRRRLMTQGAKLAFTLPFITSVLAPGPAAALSLAPSVMPTILPDQLEPDVAHNTEGYDHFEENPFRQVTMHPVSTLGADVDTASYSNVRRLLNDGQLPPAGAVRLEEMVNYFRYDDPEPTEGRPLALRAELSTCPWEPNHELLRIGLQTSPLPSEDLPPRNLVFLLDVSGSMQSVDKLPLVKASMARLVSTLGPQDRVAIAVYAGASGLALESTPGDQAADILTALDGLEAGGSTHGAAGIQLAYDVASRSFDPNGINRVILATDGDFNVGPTSRDELIRLIESYRASGIYLSVLGFGSGNLKDSSMEQLAAHGNGNYAYIDSLAEARKVLVAEGGATLVTVASDVKIQLEWNPNQVQAYRLLGYENRISGPRGVR